MKKKIKWDIIQDAIVRALGGETAMQKNYRKTLKACYLGFITQAIAALLEQESEIG